MLKVLITGTSQGIGKATAECFLNKGMYVIGVDTQLASIQHDNYLHCNEDIAQIPESGLKYNLTDLSYVVHNAGIQLGENVVKTNLLDTMKLDAYIRQLNPQLKAITFNTSISGIYGDEFPEYVASKAGLNGYVKYVAKQVMPNCIANAVCFGGVLTELNKPVMQDKDLWEKIMKVNPLKRWATAEEAADWIYFVTVVNKFATGQLFEVDGGENSCPASTFVWV